AGGVDAAVGHSRAGDARTHRAARRCGRPRIAGAGAGPAARRSGAARHAGRRGGAPCAQRVLAVGERRPAASSHRPRRGAGRGATCSEPMSRRYVLISPCRNEAQYMRRTLDTVIAQSVRPALWVIVDDGSTDDTPRILAEYQARHDWITVVTRKDRGRRAVGPGVIEAFYAGYETIRPADFDYLCKLDLDLDLPPRYFEILMQRME